MPKLEHKPKGMKQLSSYMLSRLTTSRKSIKQTNRNQNLGVGQADLSSLVTFEGIYQVMDRD